MRSGAVVILFLFNLCLWLTCLSPCALAQKEQQRGNKDSQKPQPMIINSDSLVVDEANKVITFTGQVSAKADELTIECDKMSVYYESAGSAGKRIGSTAGQSETGNAMGSKITKIVADGKVRITRQTGGEALARHAEYYQGQNKIILTGDPVVKQGEDFVQGSKITIFLRENRSIVEGSQQKRVKAVIYPKKANK